VAGCLTGELLVEAVDAARDRTCEDDPDASERFGLFLDEIVIHLLRSYWESASA